MIGRSTLWSPHPLVELVLTWYVGTPTHPGPVNVQFYGFQGHQVTFDELLGMMDLVRRQFLIERGKRNGDEAAPAPVSVPQSRVEVAP